jgi:hypothetical protein
VLIWNSNRNKIELKKRGKKHGSLDWADFRSRATPLPQPSSVPSQTTTRLLASVWHRGPTRQRCLPRVGLQQTAWFLATNTPGAAAIPSNPGGCTGQTPTGILGVCRPHGPAQVHIRWPLRPPISHRRVKAGRWPASVTGEGASDAQAAHVALLLTEPPSPSPSPSSYKGSPPYKLKPAAAL